MDVKFDEYKVDSPVTKQNRTKGMAGLLIKNGLAKDESQANIILVVVILLCLATIFVSFKFLGTSEPETPPPPTDEELNLQPS